jgi:hypothetical protein
MSKMPKSKSQSKLIPPLHRHLHLQHRRHTGRRLQHQHTSYRGLAILVVVAGVALLTLTAVARATADTILVTARNSAPIPTEPAIITSPADNAVTTTADIAVRGTCQSADLPRVVVLLLDGVPTASVPCDTDNTFAVPLTLTLGTHALSTKIYNVTNDAGPDGPTITVYYVPPVNGSTDRGGELPEAPPGSPLVLTIDEPFIVFGPAKDAVWLGTISGGALPYKVHIDWGDGHNNDYTITTDGAQRFSHRYHAMQPYIIRMHVTDADGRGAQRVYAAVTPYVPPTSLFTAGPTSPSPWSGSNMLGIYGAYLLLVAALGFLWIRRHPFAYAKVPVRSGGYRGDRRTSSRRNGPRATR